MNIGIIGGADGPTQIFVGSTTDFVWLAVGVVAIVGFVVAFVIWCKKRRRK